MTQDPHSAGKVLHAGAPLREARLAMVLLHGRGSTAEDILGLAAAFGLKDVAYLAPQAAGHTWYPYSFLAPRAQNEPFLSSALGKIESVVASIEAAGLRRDQVVIGGFSQGACLSTEFVARHPARYAGLIVFTGGLVGAPGELPSVGSAAGERPLEGMPAFFGSGDPDPHVPWARVVESAEYLKALGAEVQLQRYPGKPHTVSPSEIGLAKSWVLERGR